MWSGRTESYRSGHNGAVSKTVGRQRHVGSNPTLSAIRKHGLVPVFSYGGEATRGFGPTRGSREAEPEATAERSHALTTRSKYNSPHAQICGSMHGVFFQMFYAVVSVSSLALAIYRWITFTIFSFRKSASISSMSTVRPESIPWISTSEYITSRVLGSFR